MANITDQFVTSFSELYYSTTPVTMAGSTPTESEILSWFVKGGTASTGLSSIFKLDVGGTDAAATVIAIGVYTFNIKIGGVVVGTETIELTSAGTITSMDLKLKAELGGKDEFFSSTVVQNNNSLRLNWLPEHGATPVIEFDSATGTAPSALNVTNTVFVAFVDGGAGATKLVPLVMEIGTLSNEATVIDTPTFGEIYRGKLRGQLDGGQLDAQLYWAPRNAAHLELRKLSETGQEVYVGIKWNSDSTSTNSEYVYFDSFVSSFGIDTTFDDVAKVSCTFVVDGAEHFAGQTV